MTVPGDGERLWSQRYKANKAKLESGGLVLVQVVEVNPGRVYPGTRICQAPAARTILHARVPRPGFATCHHEVNNPALTDNCCQKMLIRMRWAHP